jgi:hypothetical protein
VQGLASAERHDPVFSEGEQVRNRPGLTPQQHSLRIGREAIETRTIETRERLETIEGLSVLEGGSVEL